MNTSDLDTLLQVVRLGSFSAAARELAVDPSSVSRVVASLEAELGARLLQRTTRKLALTEAGALFVERVAPLVEELALAREALRDATGQVRGTLRISVSNAFGVRRVIPLLPEFCRQHPHLDIDLMLSDVLVDLLAERVDLALRLGALHDSTLVAVPLAPVSYRVVASPEWLRAQAWPPAAPESIDTLSCLTFSLPGFRERWLFRRRDDAAAPEIPVAVRPRVVMTNGLALREAVLRHMGLSLLPDWLIDEDLAQGRLVDLYPDWRVAAGDAPSGAWALYPSRSHVPAKVRLFVEFLRAALAPAGNPHDNVRIT